MLSDFYLHYQPILYLQDLTCILGYEALLRHPAGWPPCDLLREARRVNAIPAWELRVLERAVEEVLLRTSDMLFFNFSAEKSPSVREGMKGGYRGDHGKLRLWRDPLDEAGSPFRKEGVVHPHTRGVYRRDFCRESRAGSKEKGCFTGQGVRGGFRTAPVHAG